MRLPKVLLSLRHARLAQRFDEGLCEFGLQEIQRLTHKAQRKARRTCKKLVECIPGFLLTSEFGERGRQNGKSPRPGVWIPGDITGRID